jgi:hydrophobe/amphiphile efflux-1 (HAE1) family protein
MIWNACIRHPVVTIVAVLVVGVFGIWSYTQMPVRENPDVQFPVISVNVVYPGAEPEVIETEIVEPLEEEINTVEGLKTLTSTSRESVATITAEFELYRDIDVAAQDVRDRVNRARRELPDRIEEPIVRKIDPDARAILWVALTGDQRWDVVRLSNYADNVLKQRIESLRGVGRVIVGGQRRYAVRLRLDPSRMAVHRVTAGQVIGTLQDNNVDIPTGRVESEQREFVVKTEGQFSDPGPINDLIITWRNGAPIRIGDIGLAVDGVENDRQIGRFKGEPAVGLGIVKQSDANTVAVSERVRSRLDELSEDLPAGLEYEIATDASVYIEDSVRDLLFTIGLAAGLVAVVVLAFLKTFRGTFISALAIPVSLLGGVTAMYLMGFSINTLTMLGLILAIGIVVDDAVVVLENTYRHVEAGYEPIPAARIGTTEVAFPSIANTLALASVFVPVAFVTGVVGRFFQEFALTVAVTVLASTATALTLTSMASSRLLVSGASHGRIYNALEKMLDKMETGYGWLLDRALDHRWITLLLAAAAFAGGVLAAMDLSTEFLPDVDREEFLIRFELPEGASLAQTDRYARRVERMLKRDGRVKHFFMIIGLSQGAGPGKVNEGMFFVRLTPRQQRRRHQEVIMGQVRDRLEQIPGARAFVISTGGVGPSGQAPVQIVLQHPRIDALADKQGEVMQWMAGEQVGFVGINSDLKLNQPQVRVRILRDRAGQMGISVRQISETLRILLGQPDVSEIQRQAERYEVIPEIVTRGRMVPEQLDQIYVRAADGSMVALSNLTRTEEILAPSEIHHYNRVRSATISASLAPGAALGDALGRAETRLDDRLGGQFDSALTGQSQDFAESFRSLGYAMAFAVLFIYLVLTAQFESFIHPLTILMALPLAATGAFAGLWLLSMPLGIVAYIGLIMLMGMATKNAILLVDYANVLRRRGEDLFDAVADASRRRFRPVVMTTISTVLGLMPIALGFGAGGTGRAPLGVAVVCGLTATTGLTLLVIPVIHTLVTSLRQRLVVDGSKEART